MPDLVSKVSPLSAQHESYTFYHHCFSASSSHDYSANKELPHLTTNPVDAALIAQHANHRLNHQCFSAGSSHDYHADEELPPLTPYLVDKALDEVRPYLIADGGNVEVAAVQDGVVMLRLQGACGTCPSSTATMKMGIERSLRVSFCLSVIVQFVSLESCCKRALRQLLRTLTHAC